MILLYVRILYYAEEWQKHTQKAANERKNEQLTKFTQKVIISRENILLFQSSIFHFKRFSV